MVKAAVRWTFTLSIIYFIFTFLHKISLLLQAMYISSITYPKLLIELIQYIEK